MKTIFNSALILSLSLMAQPLDARSRGEVEVFTEVDVPVEPEAPLEPMVWVGPGWYWGVWFDNEVEFDEYYHHHHHHDHDDGHHHH